MQDTRLKQAVRPLVHFVRRLRGRLGMRRGRPGSLEPLSRSFGYDRGKPIDRLYIESFLERHASDIAGNVLEIGGDLYSRRFGGERVTRQDVLNFAPGPAATIVGDRADPDTLPASTFDCIIITQTLQYVFDVRAAMRHLRRSLRPGGVLLVTVPAIGPLGNDEWRDSFYWIFTANSVERLLKEAFDPAQVEVAAFGNLYAATAFLHGAAVEEVNAEKLRPVDPSFSVTVAGRAVA